MMCKFKVRKVNYLPKHVNFNDMLTNAGILCITEFTVLDPATGGTTYTHTGGASATKYFYEVTGF